MNERIEIAEKKIDAIYESVERVRKNILYLIFLTAGFLILPILGIAVLVAILISNIS